MTRVYQTRFMSDGIRGNCFPAVIASLLDKNCAEDVIQIQEHYDNQDWIDLLEKWLTKNGYEYHSINGHLNNDELYLVSGESPRDRSIHHICIYQNGKLLHDPHPDGIGILTEDFFSVIEKLK